MLHFVRTLVVGLCAVWASACSPPPEPLAIGTNIWTGYEPLYLARHHGWLGDIRLVELTSASDVMDALRNGQLDAGALTLDETLTLVSEGHDFVVVLIFDISAGADAMLAGPSVADLKAIKGKRIAVETTAVGGLMLNAALDSVGLNLADVEVRHLTLSKHVEAFKSGQIDAAVTYAPHDSQLVAAGAHRVFDSRSMPGQIVDVLAVRRSLLTRRGDDLSRLVEGYYKARALFDTDRASALEVINQRLKLPRSELPGAFTGLQLPSREEAQAMLEGSHSKLAVSAEKMAVVMRDSGLLTHVPVLRDFTDDRLLVTRHE